MTITYTFDGANFSTYGVFVSGSEGLMGVPKRKAPEKYEYPDSNGQVVDLSSVVYEARTIKLDCFIKASSVALLMSQYYAFTKLIQAKTGNKTLSVSVDGNALTFSSYVDDISDLKKKFNSGQNVGTFTITFIEPEPVIS